MADDARIVALANGEPLWKRCDGWDNPHHDNVNPKPCPDCHGTGRIHTQPSGAAEEAVARLASNYNAVVTKLLERTNEVIATERERDAAKAAEAEAREETIRANEGMLRIMDQRDEALARAERAEQRLAELGAEGPDHLTPTERRLVEAALRKADAATAQRDRLAAALQFVLSKSENEMICEVVSAALREGTGEKA